MSGNMMRVGSHELTNYTKKCMSDSGVLECKKKHMHVREIVPDWKNPKKVFLNNVAKAVRGTKKNLQEHTWTLWKQTTVQAVLRHRIQSLGRKQGNPCVCPCGKEKKL